ncbi:uncharacterized protein HMPREF1541_05657 [Cyphellophora europaea CBS 101466]|uniref:Alpha/beta hydrolase fold-3 domain-containing protein n=1 Tax=Cyphellophora europaea (strain CBS 101466) TaxID=1220924 RepID=W2RUR6_CYPE1|nr:uncharacterized protein HMPREF1541_05657 [Cyphellophora europaea CBS 101466]ETN39434.1 hypothetical protein HMPREF1541_05657 [Cyphellophora europaea CBS 101466]
MPKLSAGQWMTSIPYAKENFLQSYDIFPTVPKFGSPPPQYWVVYIHGGFYRDPLVLKESFHPTVQLLTSSSNQSLQSSVAGYATLDYRLSPHTNHTQPIDTPPFAQRTAVWPQHLDDVLAAIKQLQSVHKFGSNYVLAGHSVGAQLALLAALRAEDSGFPAPKVVLGISGIYDFPLILEDHPEYSALVFNAMKEGEEIPASPAFHKAEHYEDAGVEKVVLAHSKDDGLVPWNQVEAMSKVLQQSEKGEDYVSVVELHGQHNDIWRDGKESSRAILAALQQAALC